MNNAIQIVKDLNAGYALAIGYTAFGEDGIHGPVYCSAKMCMAENPNATPVAGFVLLDRKSECSAAFEPSQWFDTYSAAMAAFELKLPKAAEPPLIALLDEEYAVFLGYTTIGPDGQYKDVFTSESDCKAAHPFDEPQAGFIILEKASGLAADVSEDWFATYEEAVDCYLRELKLELPPFLSSSVEPVFSVSIGDRQLEALYYQGDLGNSGEVSIVLRMPDGKIQNIVSVNVDADREEATVFVWDDPYEAVYSDSEVIPFREILDGDSKASEMMEEKTAEDASVDVPEGMLNETPKQTPGDTSEETSDGFPEVITDFSGEYDFLNNSYMQRDNPICVWGMSFLNAEAAFQSRKCLSHDQQEQFCSLDARSAKRLGRNITCRPGWDLARSVVMHEVLTAKFSQDEELKRKLLSTGTSVLEPHNINHDNFWGSCQCAACADREKKNMLGKILMTVRDELRNA